MIRIKRPAAGKALSRATGAFLKTCQARASALTPRDPRIEAEWKRFLGSSHRQDIAAALDETFHYKCAYCEQVAAKDIEHFHPKSDYPGKMFRWDNFLRGCKNCNHAKRDKFPLAGRTPLLLNPCKDEPLDYFVWDYRTGRPGAHPLPARKKRAEATRDLFLLDHEPLNEERKKKLLAVLFLLGRVVKENPVAPATIAMLQVELDPSRPWLAIVKQLFRKPGAYQPLVASACAKLPQLSTWV